MVSTDTFIQADDKWIPSVCTLLGFYVLYVPTCFTTKFSVANNQPRISIRLFNQLRLCPALWHVNSAAFQRYIVSLPFSASLPIGATWGWARGTASPSKNGRRTPFPAFPLNLTTGAAAKELRIFVGSPVLGRQWIVRVGSAPFPLLRPRESPNKRSPISSGGSNHQRACTSRFDDVPVGKHVRPRRHPQLGFELDLQCWLWLELVEVWRRCNAMEVTVYVLNLHSTPITSKVLDR